MADTTPTHSVADIGEHADVMILGGGLAGLCLALQLRTADPGLAVVVAERRAYRPKMAAFKVGESTSEVGAYYFADVLGLADHLADQHIRKTGLRFYVTTGGNEDIAQRVEFGTPLHHEIATYQIDRGLFENELWDRNAAAGTTLLRGCKVEEVHLAADGHRVMLAQEEVRREISARWVVDATGRAGIIKRTLGLGQPVDHTINAAWLRLAEGFDIEEWSSDPSWLARMDARGLRQRATNHLSGPGYWIWLIQLRSGPISIGVCADPRLHPFERIKTLDAFVDWLHEHEPQLAATVDGRRDEVMDFLVVEDFAYAVEQLFSPDRWCLVGEAGFFLDPLYSPGSDFIAYANTYATDLIVRDARGEDIEERREFYDFLMNELFRGALNLYEDQYPAFGNPQVLVAKVAWDLLTYWSGLCQWFRRDKTTDLDWFVSLLAELPFAELLESSQRLFRQWHELEHRRWRDARVALGDLQPVRERQEDMVADLDDDALRDRILEGVEVVKCLLVALFHKALELLPDHHIDPETPIQPLAVDLDPSTWEAEGLVDEEEGISLTDALARLPGVEALWLDQKATPDSQH